MRPESDLDKVQFANNGAGIVLAMVSGNGVRLVHAYLPSIATHESSGPMSGPKFRPGGASQSTTALTFHTVGGAIHCPKGNRLSAT